MKIATRKEIGRVLSSRGVLSLREVIPMMREALVAQSRGECETPMPMHLNVRESGGEIHIKSSYREGGQFFAVKIVSGFPENAARNLPAADGMILLASAETGEPMALLCDGGDLTVARTAAVSAMVARELGRSDASLGVLGSGVQARWQVRAHAEVLSLKEVWLWGRSPEHVRECREDLMNLVGGIDVRIATSPADVARHTKLIVTATASRAPLLSFEDIAPGTFISAVGSDSHGKQELHPQILTNATLVLVDSIPQCERLGELQHAPAARSRAVEIGKFCDFHPAFDAGGIAVADFTGLGVEDLYIAEACYRKLAN
ncbi:MAG TPA: ornithine cyclodeaminase family protein [Candidatus Acidoferrales bacterium]|nr:ornithine cyclodeaminase family protein [Candidatus Acidoferrales bacterium]